MKGAEIKSNTCLVHTSKIYSHAYYVSQVFTIRHATKSHGNILQYTSLFHIRPLVLAFRKKNQKTKTQSLSLSSFRFFCSTLTTPTAQTSSTTTSDHVNVLYEETLSLKKVKTREINLRG